MCYYELTLSPWERYLKHIFLVLSNRTLNFELPLAQWAEHQLVLLGSE